MDDLSQIVRGFHLVIRVWCFGVGAFKLYPILYFQMKQCNNGLKPQRRNIQGVMFFFALMLSMLTFNQISRWNEPLSNVNFWISAFTTFAVVGITYYGVKMFNFKCEIEEKESYGFGQKQKEK